MEGFPSSSRFEPRRRLGAGAFGVVYEAYDRERQLNVALKTLISPASDALYLFKHEFRSLADLNHRNLVTLYELVADSPHWFFTMELLRGRNFVDHVWDIDPALADAQSDPRQSMLATVADSTAWATGEQTVARLVDEEVVHPGRQLDYDGVRSALSQLAEGLIVLHDAGKLHRDIKPRNVIVTVDGRVVLLDFGLSMDLSAWGTDLSTPRIVGTPAYMAPEQAAAGTASPASDWYSVGVMLYETLTSRLPFVGSAGEIIARKQHEDPTPVEVWSPRTPVDLSRLCAELLTRDAARRPSGYEVLRRLDRGSQSTAGPVRSARVPAASTFVGRDRELTSLAAAYDAMTGGRAVVAYVHGVSGIGKTTIVQQFLDQLAAEVPGVVILKGRCYQQESVPYKGLDLLIDTLSQWLITLPSATVDLLLPRNVPALVRVFPVLNRVEALALAPRRLLDPPDAQELRRRAFAAFRELIARVADRWPLVLFVDDLQWSDLDSTHLLGELLRSPDAPKLLFIGAYRSDEVETSPALRAFLALARTPDFDVETRDLALGELPARDVQALVAALADVRAGSLAPLIDSVHREAGGNPFLVHELTRLALSEGAALQPRQVSLERAMDLRLSSIVGPAARLLDVLAVAGRPVSSRVALSAAGVLPEDYGLVASLRVAQLIRTRQTDDGEELELYHDRIRDVVTRALPGPQAIHYHERLALALEKFGDGDPERLALHFDEAGRPDLAAGHAAVAADRAAEALAFDRAARLYQLALRLQAEGGAAAGLRLKLADALTNAGRGYHAGRAYLDAAGDAEHDPPRFMELQRRAAEQFLISGHMDEGLTSLDSVLRAVNMRLARTPSAAVALLILRRVLIRLRGLRFREREASAVPPADLLKIDSCWSVAVGLAYVDSMRAAEFQARHCLLALRSGEPSRVARALALEAGYSSLGGTHTSRRTTLVTRSALSLAERLGQPHAIGLASLTAGIAAHMEGRWRASQDLCVRADTVLRESCTGVTWELDTARLHILSNTFFLGDLTGLCERAPALIKSAAERGDVYGSTAAVLRMGFIAALVRHEPGRAREELTDAESAWSAWREFLMQHYWSLMARLDVLAYEGRGAEAFDLIGSRRQQIGASQMLRVQFSRIEWSYRRARSALMYALDLPRGDSRRARLLREVEHDCRTLLRESVDWSVGLGHLVNGGAAFANGDVHRALTSFTIAEEKFESAGMALHAVLARRARGRALGGEQGRALVDAGEQLLRADGVVTAAGFDRMVSGWSGTVDS